jgi:hypothetical protein
MLKNANYLIMSIILRIFILVSQIQMLKFVNLYSVAPVEI